VDGLDVMKREQETLLVLRAQAGDHAALDEILKLVQEPLYRYIHRLVGELTLAEDILQEVFIRIYRKLKWLHEPELFRPWAYRIASREAFKHLRRERRWAEQIRDEEVLEMIPAEEASAPLVSDFVEHFPQLVARVSPASRAVLILHYMDEMPLAEIADILGIAVGTVKSRLAYGLESLRRAIREQQAGAGETGQPQEHRS
jgi:RNA polymerase sigma-70 factor (ECF subfamily)